MKNIFSFMVVLGLLFAGAVSADSDKSVMIEFAFGFGKSGEYKPVDHLPKVCAHQGSSGQKGFVVRYKVNDIEYHVAHWGSKDQGKCNRNNTAFGVGVVKDSEGFGTKGDEGNYATATVGVSFLTRKNWRIAHHVQPFSKLAVGFKLSDTVDFETGVTHYGWFNKDRGESFLIFGYRHSDRARNDDLHSLVTPEGGGEEGGGSGGGSENDCRPGLGLGDTNNCHDGPPGLN